MTVTLEIQTTLIIQCQDVVKMFGDFVALRNVSVQIQTGEVVCIVGPSGSGKSTILRTMNGLETFQGGSITVDGISLPGSRAERGRVRREVGMVFQQFNLFPHLTVRRNPTLAPMTALNPGQAEADERAEHLLARVGISDQIDKYPPQLSGGQQQCVAIARALAMRPKILLFDEGREIKLLDLLRYFGMLIAVVRTLFSTVHPIVARATGRVSPDTVLRSV